MDQKKIERKANDIPTDGKVLVENGIGKLDSAEYTFLYSLDSDIGMDTTYFKKIVKEAAISAKWKCKYRPTFEPTHVSLLPQKGFNPSAGKDSNNTIFEYRAENGFGVPDDLSSVITIYGGRAIRD